MKLTKGFISLVFLCSGFANLSAQIAITKLLVYPAGEFNEDVWFKMNAPAFPESLDTLFDSKKRIASIKRTYSDGSVIDTTFTKKGQTEHVFFSSKEDRIELDFNNNQLTYVLLYKWGIADSTSRRQDYVKHGKTLEFIDGQLRYAWNYKWGKLLEYEKYKENRLAEKFVYIDGPKDYMRMEYFDNGKVLSSVRFIKNKVSGRANYYFKDGEKLAEFEFKEGRLEKGKIHKSPVDKDGIIVTNQDPDVMWYHCAPDGSFCCECHTRKGKVSCKPIKQKK